MRFTGDLIAVAFYVACVAGSRSERSRGCHRHRLGLRVRYRIGRMFRRDPEDMGVWTPVASFPVARLRPEDEAMAAAEQEVPWLARVLGP